MAAWPPCALNVTVGEPGWMDWYDEAEPCVTVYKLRITPPGSTEPAVIRVGADAFANVVICSGGLVTMNPVRAAPY